MGRLLVGLVALTFVLLGCSSPEARRARGGGPGADPGNRQQVVEMHEGSEPYHGTKQIIGPYGMAGPAPARQARRLGRGEARPEAGGSASPSEASPRR